MKIFIKLKIAIIVAPDNFALDFFDNFTMKRFFPVRDYVARDNSKAVRWRVSLLKWKNDALNAFSMNLFTSS